MRSEKQISKFEQPDRKEDDEEKFRESLKSFKTIDVLRTLERSTERLLNTAKQSATGILKLEGVREINKEELEHKLGAIRDEISRREG